MRRERFIAKRVDQFMGEMPLDEYNADLRAQVKDMMNGKIELSEEVE